MEGSSRKSIKSEQTNTVIETDESEYVAQNSTSDIPEQVPNDSQMKIHQLRELFLKQAQNRNIIGNRLQESSTSAVLDRGISINVNCTDNTTDIADDKPETKINPLVAEFKQLCPGFDLDSTSKQNPDELPMHERDMNQDVTIMQNSNADNMKIVEFTPTFNLNHPTGECMEGFDLTRLLKNEVIFKPEQMAKNEGNLNRGTSIIEHCTNNNIEIADVKSTTKLNPLAAEFQYLGPRFDLDGTSINEGIYNPEQMATNEGNLNQGTSIIEHCTINSIEIADIKSTTKLNSIAAEFQYFCPRFDLDGTSINEGIYNPGTNEITTDETNLDQDVTIMENCNDNSMTVDVKPKLKRNPLIRLFKCLRRGSRLQKSVSSNGNINPDTNEIPTILSNLDQDVAIVENSNENNMETVEIIPTFNLNHTAEECLEGFDLNGISLNERISNTITNEITTDETNLDQDVTIMENCN